MRYKYSVKFHWKLPTMTIQIGKEKKVIVKMIVTIVCARCVLCINRYMLFFAALCISECGVCVRVSVESRQKKKRAKLRMNSTVAGGVYV